MVAARRVLVPLCCLLVVLVAAGGAAGAPANASVDGNASQDGVGTHTPDLDADAEAPADAANRSTDVGAVDEVTPRAVEPEPGSGADEPAESVAVPREAVNETPGFEPPVDDDADPVARDWSPRGDWDWTWNGTADRRTGQRFAAAVTPAGAAGERRVGGSTADQTGTGDGGIPAPGASGLAAGSGVLVVAALARRLDLALAASGQRPSVDSRAVTQYFGRFVRRLPFVPLSAPDGLDPDHEHREALLSLVERTPGVHQSEAAEELGVSVSTLRHHVRALEADGELVTADVLGRQRLFPASDVDPVLAALNDEGTARVLTALADREQATGSQLVEELDRAHSTVSYHLDRLAEEGIVEREREGNRVLNRLTPDARETLDAAATDADPASVPSPGDD